MFDVNFLNSLLNEWVNYYGYVYNSVNQYKLVLLPFDTITKSDCLASFLKQNKIINNIEPDQIDIHKQQLEKNQHDLTLHTTSTPDKSRTQLKNEIKPIIKKNSLIEKANELFNALVIETNH